MSIHAEVPRLARVDLNCSISSNVPIAVRMIALLFSSWPRSLPKKVDATVQSTMSLVLENEAVRRPCPRRSAKCEIEADLSDIACGKRSWPRQYREMTGSRSRLFDDQTLERNAPGLVLPPMKESAPDEVLVVEDEPLVRIAAADALVDHGIMAREAGDASEALLALDKHPRIRVLFTDINMPGEPDGLELAKKVSEDRPDVEIIVTSGATKMSNEDLPDDGVFLAKPYSSERLVQMVEQKLERGTDTNPK